MVPNNSLVADPVIGLPEPYVHMLLSQCGQYRLNLRIILGYCFIIVSGSGYTYDLTRLTDTELFFFYKNINSFPLLLRR